jgi:hypothetical protein
MTPLASHSSAEEQDLASALISKIYNSGTEHLQVYESSHHSRLLDKLSSKIDYKSNNIGCMPEMTSQK